MPNVPGPDAPLPSVARRYDDDEIGRILRRATQLQRAEPTAADPTGITLAELEEIALEAGIDAANVRRAAAELDAAPPSRRLLDRAAGGPVRLRLERTYPGELPLDAFDEIIPLIQEAADSSGNASRVGRTLTWSSQTHGNTRSLQVLLVARDGETGVRIEERLHGLASALHGGFVLGGGVGLGFGVGVPLGLAISTSLGPLIVPAALVAGSYAGARAVFRHISGRRRRALVRLLDQIGERVASWAGKAEARSLPRPVDGETSTLPPGRGPDEEVTDRGM